MSSYGSKRNRRNMEVGNGHFNTIPKPMLGLAKNLSNKTPIERAKGFNCCCPICDQPFKIPTSHLLRIKTEACCSRACAIEYRKIRVKMNCVVCEKEMEIAPCLLSRVVTCSKICRTKNRLKNLNNRTNPIYCEAVKQAKKKGNDLCAYCENPGDVVEGVKTEWNGTEYKLVDNDPVLLCQRCHMNRISPIGHKTKREKHAI